MTDSLCLARIRGLPHLPDITQINVRSGPGTNYDIPFQGSVGLDNLPVLAVAEDEEGRNLSDKVYQWFKLSFPDGSTGWVRDDLLDVKGNCSDWGYGTHPPETFAFALTRNTVSPEKSDTIKSDEPQPSKSAAGIIQAKTKGLTDYTQIDIDRIRRASFAVTAAFEGTGYASFNNYDAGVISYGFLQFTLASGSLATVVDRFLAASNSSIAKELKSYKDRIKNHDATLKDDENLKLILVSAANELEMQQAQNAVAITNYWDAVVDGYITHRGLQLPLTYGLLFDMGVNFGTGHGFVRLAEEQLGVPLRSRPGENGITEQLLIGKVAELRKASHDRQAERDNLPGLKARGDFWIERINLGDWDFTGNSRGTVSVNGHSVQIANP